MKRISVGLVLMTLCIFSVIAQDKIITVSGRVVESDTNEPATQASVQLLSLPDSASVAGVACSEQGWFTLPKVKAGNYVIKVSYLGFTTRFIPVQLSNEKPTQRMGTILLEADAIMLKETVVTAQAPEVVVREDTIEYNATAYRTSEGAMLKELVKKLPGAEVDDDGNVTINGKEVKKIMVEGKEFFGGDVKTGLDNLPVNMVDRIKTYEKKSDLARITGIDDGEEETVLDLKVKKGMNQGWFGNLDVAIGTKDRYSSNLMLNRFVEGSQFSLIGSANNVNDQGFSSGGGRPRFGNSNGLTATKMIGANFATETDKLEMGGSVRYNFRDVDLTSINSSERFLTSGNSYSNSNSSNRNKNKDLNADFRLEWKPDTMTNIIFRPNFSYGNTDSYSSSESSTFNEDPLNYVASPNDYLTEGIDADLDSIRVNSSDSKSQSNGNSLSANGSLQFNRKLNSVGRNITFRGTFNYSDNDNKSSNQSLTHYFEMGTKDDVRRFTTSPTKSFDYTAQITYSEPIAKSTFLQFSYKFQYKYNKSDKSVYDLSSDSDEVSNDWEFSDPLPDTYKENKDVDLSKYAKYKYYNHDIMVGLNLIREKYHLNFGLSLQPQNTRLDYQKSQIDTIVKRNVLNFAPNVDFRYRFSNVSQLRFVYRGRASQPDMENLLDVTDNTDPLNIRKGNPGLKPSFSHTMRLFYNNYVVSKQQGMIVHIFGNINQNSVANNTIYDPTTGGVTVMPENINGNWNASGIFGFNSALNDRRFTYNTNTRVSYDNSVSFYNNNDESDSDKSSSKNKSTNLTLGEDLRGTFRNDWLEFTLNGSINYNFERNKLNPESNQEPFTYGYGASTNISLPWNMSISTNITNNVRRGYRDSSMNRSELVWNAQIAQSFLKSNAATVSFEVNDILKRKTNISRSLTSELRSVSESNAINSYCMLHFIYRLNIFGNKDARRGMHPGGFDGNGPRGPRGEGGGFGGGRGGFGGGNFGGGMPPR